MPRHRLPGIGEQVLLFVALPSSLPVERYVADPASVQNRGWDVSDKVYRKPGWGANGRRLRITAAILLLCFCLPFCRWRKRAKRHPSHRTADHSGDPAAG